MSHEGLDLEKPALEPQYNKTGFLELGVSPEQAPDKPTYVTDSALKRAFPPLLTARRWTVWL